jgi:hypothetical protein
MHDFSIDVISRVARPASPRGTRLDTSRAASLV